MSVLFGILAAAFSWFILFAASIRAEETFRILPKNPDYTLSQNWAQYSPWFPAGRYVGAPEECTVDQVNLIQRHGARFPTDGATERIVAALGKIQSVEEYTDTKLDFLSNFEYDLGFDDLVPFGARESSDSGAEFFHRYRELVKEGLPFVRASGSERVILSATNWTAGIAEASSNIYQPELALILPEDLNDTLDDSMCPNAGNSDAQTAIWLGTYAPPITARLNAGAPGANLSDADTYALQSLCPFVTVAKERPSPFCGLFTEEEFAVGFEYAGDLDKYYNTGYGQDLGPVQGVGYINELLARLTNSPVNDSTQTNRTLDADPATFPLNRTLYADFSHDNQMIAIYAAIGLFPQQSPPDPAVPREGRDWVASRLVPFSARMVTERLSCAAGAGEGEGGKFVRIFVNDALQPLEFCGADGNGLCKLEDFVESQSYARNNGEGDFERCFA